MTSRAGSHPSFDAMLLRDHTIREQGTCKVAAFTLDAARGLVKLVPNVAVRAAGPRRRGEVVLYVIRQAGCT
jgi:hypothetical protein